MAAGVTSAPPLGRNPPSAYLPIPFAGQGSIVNGWESGWMRCVPWASSIDPETSANWRTGCRREPGISRPTPHQLAEKFGIAIDFVMERPKPTGSLGVCRIALLLRPEAMAACNP
jgi:hypothetical protein